MEHAYLWWPANYLATWTICLEKQNFKRGLTNENIGKIARQCKHTKWTDLIGQLWMCGYNIEVSKSDSIFSSRLACWCEEDG